MSRPVVLLAGFSEPDPLVATLTRAGFEAVLPVSGSADPSELPDLAVLDCDGPADVVARAYSRVHGGNQVPTMLLFSDEPPEVMSDISASDELALKPMAGEGMVYRLQAMLIRAGHRTPTADDVVGEPIMAGEAHVVGVFAPKGGVGKTTVAVNVAVAIRQQTRSRVLLLDADAGVGNVTSVVSVPDTRGLVDLADSPSETWTDEAFEHLVVTHAESGVRVMTWGSHPADADKLGTDLLLAALRWAKHHHDYVVVDTHPGYDDKTMAMLTASSEVLLVVTPEIGALKNTAQFLEMYEEMGLNMQIRVVANRSNHGVDVNEMATALGIPISATVVSSGPRAVQASNEGRPLVLRFPNERVSNDLHALARMVVRGPDAVEVAEPRRRFTLNSFQRAQA